MDKNDISNLGFDQVGEMVNLDYADNGVAFVTDMGKLPQLGNALRMDMFAMIACIRGRMQAEVNGRVMTVEQRQVAIARPNDVVENYMLSPDFEGAALCMSQTRLLEQISDTELWNKAFFFLDSPIISVSEQSLGILRLYGELINAKLRMPRTDFQRQSILSIVKAALYEVLDNLDTSHIDVPAKSSVRQSDVLFKRFVSLMAGLQVKPRSVTWYAEQLCVSPKHLSTVCKNVSAKTAFEWINGYVMIDIRHMLKDSDKSIKEVAEALDFPNISFFGKYCRAHFGVSPMELRRKLREEGDD